MFNSKSKVSTDDLIARDGWCCSYCGDFLALNMMTVDHVIPTLRGGLDVLANTVISCLACNASKGNMTAHEFNHRLSVERYVSEIAPNEIIEFAPIEITTKDGLTSTIALPALWAGAYTLNDMHKQEWCDIGAFVIRIGANSTIDVVVLGGALFDYYADKKGM